MHARAVSVSMIKEMISYVKNGSVPVVVDFVIYFCTCTLLCVDINSI